MPLVVSESVESLDPTEAVERRACASQVTPGGGPVRSRTRARRARPGPGGRTWPGSVRHGSGSSPREFYLSEATIKTHVGRILAKTGIRDRVALVVLAYEIGLVRPQA